MVLLEGRLAEHNSLEDMLRRRLGSSHLGHLSRLLFQVGWFVSGYHLV